MDKNTLYEMYQKAVNFAPYSFFYINTNAKDVSKISTFKFKHSIQVPISPQTWKKSTEILVASSASGPAQAELELARQLLCWTEFRDKGLRF